MKKGEFTRKKKQVLSTRDPLRRLIGVVALLRDPDMGCPWDREQTLESLKPFLIEETYEVLDAIDSGDPVRLVAELGDLLLQVFILSQIGADNGWFDIRDVAERLCDKLVRRHPHVFGAMEAGSANEVLEIWEQMKKKEGSGLLDGIPKHMPALHKAWRMGQKAARVGFDWPEDQGILDKVREEAEELTRASTREEQVVELGDLLFALANLGRRLGIDPEDALQKCNRRFRSRFAYVEAQLARMGKEPVNATLEEMDRLWDEAKRLYNGA